MMMQMILKRITKINKTAGNVDNDRDEDVKDGGDDEENNEYYIHIVIQTMAMLMIQMMTVMHMMIM